MQALVALDLEGNEGPALERGREAREGEGEREGEEGRKTQGWGGGAERKAERERRGPPSDSSQRGKAGWGLAGQGTS